MKRRFLLIPLVLLLAGVAVVAVLAWRSEIDPVPAPSATEFNEELVTEGARLAAIGNCVDCHTAPGGPPFAGGYAMNTPFGVIYGTNITPDPDTGIGTWSEAAFVRAMREGVDREGRHLYPAFPYDQFTRADDEDLRALYAFLMTREPVRYEAPAPEVPFPLGFRPLLAGWKLLFHEDERLEPAAERSEEWNQGRYLVDGLAHCGACHTPRNFLGARDEDRHLAGGESELWYAPPLDSASTAPVPWTRQSLERYLRSGFAPDHAVAAGPMAPVVRNLAQVPEEDVTAIATYVADVMGAEEAPPEAAATRDEAPRRPLDDPFLQQGELLFDGACAMCHEPNGPLPFSAGVSLADATSLAHAEPRNAILVVLDGVEQPLTAGEPLMPGFATALQDGQIASIIAYLRDRFTDQPAWEDLEAEVARLREAQAEQEVHFGVAAGGAIEELRE